MTVQVPASGWFGTPVSAPSMTTVARVSWSPQIGSASGPPTTGSSTVVPARSTDSSVPGCGRSVNSESVDQIISPICEPAGITWSSGCSGTVTSTNCLGVSGFSSVSESRFSGSAQPRVMTLVVGRWVLDAQAESPVHGSFTSATVRLARAFEAAMRTVTSVVPDRWTFSVSVGVV